MMRAATFLWALLATIAGAGLFLLKYQVQAEERHLREVRKDIAGTEQSKIGRASCRERVCAIV